MSLQEAITEFRGQFHGVVIEPADPSYDGGEKSLQRDDRSQTEADRQVHRCRRRDELLCEWPKPMAYRFRSGAADTMPLAWASAMTVW